MIFTVTVLRVTESLLGKEVICMRYSKPSIVRLADAVMAIQGSKLRGMFDAVDPHNPIKSSSAYDIDE